jgi:asparagine synthase (glutamine-hydrolysing)
MSGQFGVVSLDGMPLDRAALERMLRRIAYRGSDAQQLWFSSDDRAALGNALARLAPESAEEQQPFALGNLAITFDGRLDGRDELIRALKTAGREVSTATPDSALLLHVYSVWETKCLTHVIGNFSFAIWDGERGRLFAARDQLGLRPLYYAQIDDLQKGQTLVFGNELGPLRMYPGVSSQLDDTAITGFLMFGWNLWEDKTSTAFAQIRRLLPAHALCWDKSGLKIERYWTMPTDEPMLRYRTEQEYIDQFYEVFKTTVKDRMRRKRVLISLSGGLDSSNVAAMAAHLVNSGEVNAELNALSFVFNDAHDDEEAHFAGLVATKLKIPHHFFVGDRYKFEAPLTAFAEPTEVFQSGYELDMYRLAISLGDTTLTGRAGDECLQWDPIFEVLRKLPPHEALDLYLWQWRFSGRRPPLLGLQPYLNPRRWFRRNPDHDFSGVKTPVWLNPDIGVNTNMATRQQAMWDGLHRYTHPLHPGVYRSLYATDWVTGGEIMGGMPLTPPENTSVFLDTRLIRLCLRLPHLPFFDYKYILRKLQPDRLPAEVLTRWKKPLGNILGSMLSQADQSWLNGWQAVPELARYVRREAIPPIVPSDINAAYVNIRPLLLNSWLANLHNP